MRDECILMQMRTTLNIGAEFLKKAAQMTGAREKSSLVRRGLETLISSESVRRLSRLGSTEKQLRQIRRRRSAACRCHPCASRLRLIVP